MLESCSQAIKYGNSRLTQSVNVWLLVFWSGHQQPIIHQPKASIFRWVATRLTKQIPLSRVADCISNCCNDRLQADFASFKESQAQKVGFWLDVLGGFNAKCSG